MTKLSDRDNDWWGGLAVFLGVVLLMLCGTAISLTEINRNVQRAHDMRDVLTEEVQVCARLESNQKLDCLASVTRQIENIK